MTGDRANQPLTGFGIRITKPNGEWWNENYPFSVEVWKLIPDHKEAKLLLSRQFHSDRAACNAVINLKKLNYPTAIFDRLTRTFIESDRFIEKIGIKNTIERHKTIWNEFQKIIQT